MPMCGCQTGDREKLGKTANHRQDKPSNQLLHILSSLFLPTCHPIYGPCACITVLLLPGRIPPMSWNIMTSLFLVPHRSSVEYPVQWSDVGTGWRLGPGWRHGRRGRRFLPGLHLQDWGQSQLGKGEIQSLQ